MAFELYTGNNVEVYLTWVWLLMQVRAMNHLNSKDWHILSSILFLKALKNEVTIRSKVPAGSMTGLATPYSNDLAGSTMGCNGAGPYNPADVTIVAVGPGLYDSIPCGTAIQVCGPVGCVNGVRKDSCPGCVDGHIVDLSRESFNRVCGATANNCTVTLKK